MAANGKMSNTGHKGVHRRYNNKFIAKVTIAVNRKAISKCLGTFETLEEAAKARKEYIISLL